MDERLKTEDKVMNIIKTGMKIKGGVATERAHLVGKAITIKLLYYKDKEEEKIPKAAKNLATTRREALTTRITTVAYPYLVF